MKIRRNTKGFTLVEIMIVVAIIGLLAAIAVPNFIQARTTARNNIILNDLRLLNHAVEQWALADNMGADDAIDEGLVAAYLSEGIPEPPVNTVTYEAGTVDEGYTCDGDDCP
jgi:prepilin-type N-terminal cleavage/methylation domain-containing protein